MQNIQITYDSDVELGPVYVSGSFCDNIGLKSKRDSNGKFTYFATTSLPEGTHYYRFNINGTWQLDSTKEKSADKKYNILRVTSSELAGEEFAQHEPLTTRLRNILRQYPDGGQILKELLQNGDDASAQNVCFIFDMRTHKSESLLSESLRPFQGPALIAYNSGIFEEKDFDSIRSLGASRKYTDLTKTGRFGIGFNSVYHITDLPSFISGNHLVILDPHSKYIPGSQGGKRWDLTKSPYFEDFYSDQLTGYNMLGYKTKEPFKGTLFRFPLRTPEMAQVSDISKIPYTEQSVHNLIASFKKEAPVSLLFLKHVESIKLYYWKEGEEEPEMVYAVELANLTEDVREMRKKMIEYVNSGSDQTKHYLEELPKSLPSTIFQLEVEETEDDKITETTWIISNRMGTYGKSKELALNEARAAQGLKLIPWGGIAAKKLSLEDTEPLPGKVFCFLPLPTVTNFPVHVNGCFELNSNRRDLWSGEDLEGQDQNKALWNRYLLEEVVALAFVDLLERIVKDAKNLDNFYTLWPDCDHLSDPWKHLGACVYRLIAKRKLLYSNMNGGKWIYASDAVYVPHHSTIDEEITNFLLEKGISIVEVPPHVYKSFRIAKHPLTEVTPTLVRSVLKQMKGTDFDLIPDIALKLLEYCLSDKNYTEMQGIPLIPLANSRFGTFQIKSKLHYVISSTLPHELLHKIEFLAIDVTILSQNLLQILQSSELMKVLNIKELTPTLFCTMLHNVLPVTWKDKAMVAWDSNVVSFEWLQQFWKYVANVDLSILKSWPLLPSQEVLLSLEDKPKVIPSVLPTNLRDTLRKLRVFQLDIDKFGLPLKNNSFIKYTVPGTPIGIIQAIINAGIKNFATVTDEDKEVLFRYFCKAEWPSEKQLGSAFEDLKKFPIFFNCNGQYISLKPDVKYHYAPTEIPPSDTLKLTNLLQKPSSDTKLLKLLGVKPCLKSIFYIEYIFPQLPKINPSLRDDLMIQMLDDMPKLRKEERNFLKHIVNISFIPSRTGFLHVAQDLFDPTCKNLIDLMDDLNIESKLPKEEFCETSRLATIRSLGLQTKMNRSTFINVIKRLPREEFQLEKSCKLWEYFQQEWNHFQSSNDFPIDKFETALCTLSWLPVMQKPKDYKLPWFESDKVLTSSQLSRPKKDKDLVSSIMPIADIRFQDSTRNTIIRMFGWEQPPKAVKALEHLQKISASYDPEIGTEELVQSIAHKVYELLDKTDNWDTKTFRQVPSVFISNKFWHTSQVSMTSPIDLSPVVKVIPPELLKYSSLWKKLKIVNTVSDQFMISLLNHLYTKNLGLDADRIRICISVLKFLGETKRHEEIPLLTTNNVLLPNKQVTFDDTPWMSNKTNTTTMIHSKITNTEASNLGASPSSFRMLGNAMSPMQGWSSFGQSESLCDRINTILNDYPEGPTILLEFLQNADDAGATEFKIMIDNYTYPSQSVWPGMKEFQGPSLLVYNNKMFTLDDFNAICNIGNSNKFKDPNKIGQFGLGFNSCYHITDVPSFVSDCYLVAFDPMTSYVPHATKGQPGVKIDYLNNESEIVSQFPDQFAPYNHFGFDSSQRFPGTLFRFPWRTAQCAAQSQIKKTTFSGENMKTIFMKFFKLKSSSFLFLRHILNIEIYSRSDTGTVTKLWEMVVDNRPESFKKDGIHKLNISTIRGDLVESEEWLVSSHSDSKIVSLASRDKKHKNKL